VEEDCYMDCCTMQIKTSIMSTSHQWAICLSISGIWEFYLFPVVDKTVFTLLAFTCYVLQYSFRYIKFSALVVCLDWEDWHTSVLLICLSTLWCWHWNFLVCFGLLVHSSFLLPQQLSTIKWTQWQLQCTQKGIYTTNCVLQNAGISSIA